MTNTSKEIFTAVGKPPPDENPYVEVDDIQVLVPSRLLYSQVA